MPNSKKNVPSESKESKKRKKIASASAHSISEQLRLQDLLLDRDIQWLEFNKRVLHESQDDRTPLLERMSFLGIFSSNLDEFFMKRMGIYLKRVQIEADGSYQHGRNPRQALQDIRNKVLAMKQAQADCFAQQLIPALEKQNIYLLSWDKLDERQRNLANDYFFKHVFPVLTPLAVDPGHPFPFISNLSSSLAVTLKFPGREDKLFSRIKIPQGFPNLVRVNREEETTIYHFVSLLDIIKQNLPALFPKMEICDAVHFRVTRNVDIEWDDEDSEDLLETISEEIRLRRFGDVVRLEIEKSSDNWIKEFMMDELQIHESHTYEIEKILLSGALKQIGDLKISQLKYKNWNPMNPAVLQDETLSMFHILKNEDILVHHPFESFNTTVERFITEATDDPKVQAIKMTLYRTGANSPFIPLLIRAAEKGKTVVCLVELKARFDEEQNIHWAKELEDYGVHVVYGVVGLKTHAKTILVVRQDSEATRCFVHIGTGNYNKNTATHYEDYGLFTSHPQIANEIVELFNFLTGRSLKSHYDYLLIAPVNMKDRYLELIKNEIANAQAKKPAHIILKMNALEDPTIIQALYNAASAGVKVDLIVRGFCCLKPGIKAVSNHIRVISIIGRFLEHSRLSYFRNASDNETDGLFFMGSADLMYRSLNNRVELVCPILDKNLRDRVWQHLQLMLNDERQSWEMQSDGSYIQRKSTSKNALGVHQVLMNQCQQKNRPQYTS